MQLIKTTVLYLSHSPPTRECIDYWIFPVMLILSFAPIYLGAIFYYLYQLAMLFSEYLQTR